jgi:hypothetical protein
MSLYAADRTRNPQKIKKKKKRIPSTIDIAVPDQAIVHKQVEYIEGGKEDKIKRDGEQEEEEEKNGLLERKVREVMV